MPYDTMHLGQIGFLPDYRVITLTINWHMYMYLRILISKTANLRPLKYLSVSYAYDRGPNIDAKAYFRYYY